MLLDIPTTKKCDNLKVPRVFLSNEYVTYIFMVFGINCHCNIILTLE